MKSTTEEVFETSYDNSDNIEVSPPRDLVVVENSSECSWKWLISEII